MDGKDHALIHRTAFFSEIFVICFHPVHEDTHKHLRDLDHSDPHGIEPLGLGADRHKEEVEIHNRMDGKVDAHEV